MTLFVESRCRCLGTRSSCGDLKNFRQRLNALHSDHRRIALGAMRVAAFLLLGKVFGAFKEMAIAYRYGISEVVDAYQFTLVMAGWLPVTIVGALSVVLIPAFVRMRADDRPARGRFLGELQAAVLVVGVVLAIALFFSWPYIITVAGAGLPESVQAMSRELMLAFAPAALLTLMTGISAARLRAHERHINTLLDSVPAVVILILVLAATEGAGVGPLLWGTLIGYAVQCVWLQYLAARADGVWGRPRPGFTSPHWNGLVAAAGVMLVGQVAMSFVGPVDQYTAANLGANANSTIGYATRLLSLLLGVGAASVGRAALPVLADIQSRGDPVRARTMALKWSGLMLAAGAVVTLLGWILAPWGVALLFERGAFTAQDTMTVAHVVRWGLLQIPFYFGVLVLVQLLASQGRYRLMATIAVINFLAKLVMNQILAPIMGPAGIMLATAMMYFVSYLCYAVVAARPVAVSASPV